MLPCHNILVLDGPYTSINTIIEQCGTQEIWLTFVVANKELLVVRILWLSECTDCWAASINNSKQPENTSLHHCHQSSSEVQRYLNQSMLLHSTASPPAQTEQLSHLHKSIIIHCKHLAWTSKS